MNNTLTHRPLRILHVLKGMNPGGIETWLRNAMQSIDRDRLRFDFLTGTEQPCIFDAELQEMGCRIIPCMGARHPWVYARNFIRLVNLHGPYDVIHSHVHHYSGFVCWLARQAGIPVRIAHSHSDNRIKEDFAPWPRQAYLRAMEVLVRRNATHGLACSGAAAEALFGKKWQQDARWTVLPCGINCGAFRIPPDRQQVRNEMGIPPDALVVGHVGRFSEAKNHSFALDVLAVAMARNPRIHALFVGDGPMKTFMMEKASKLGIGGRVVFAGIRSDIPRLMMGAMDVFLFPSKWEGLGLVAIEAQAAGLPCLMSDTIPSDTDIVPELIRRMPISKGQELWARTLLDMPCRDNTMATHALNSVEKSAFSLDRSVRMLQELYFKAARISTSEIMR